MKVSKRDRLKQTPFNFTGNELNFNLKRRKLNQRKMEANENYENDQMKDEEFFEDDFSGESD